MANITLLGIVKPVVGSKVWNDNSNYRKINADEE